MASRTQNTQNSVAGLGCGPMCESTGQLRTTTGQKTGQLWTTTGQPGSKLVVNRVNGDKNGVNRDNLRFTTQSNVGNVGNVSEMAVYRRGGASTGSRLPTLPLYVDWPYMRIDSALAGQYSLPRHDNARLDSKKSEGAQKHGTGKTIT